MTIIFTNHNNAQDGTGEFASALLGFDTQTGTFSVITETASERSIVHSGIVSVKDAEKAYFAVCDEFGLDC